MENKTLYDEYMEDKEFERLMAQEDLIMEATEFLCSVMEYEKVNRSKLALLMDRTKGYISQILGGGKNLTLRTLSDVAYHLGYSVKLTLTKKVKRVHEDRVVIDWDLSQRQILDNRCFEVADDYSVKCHSISRLAG